MRAMRIGYISFAVGFAGLGMLSLLSGDFALNWQPVPAWVPGRTALAYASGVMLLAGGLGMLVKRTARAALLLLIVNLLIWLLLLRLPRVLPKPADVGLWLGVSETLMLVIGAWILFASVAARTEERSVRAARFLFALALPILGLSHFAYSQFTAAMVPAWLPFRLGLTFFTGAAHIAAGLGLLFGVFPRLAATLEALMISLFTLLVWVPPLFVDPMKRLGWTAMFISMALAAVTWAVAGSLSDLPWSYLAFARGGTRGALTE